jgi:hypothetical protein
MRFLATLGPMGRYGLRLVELRRRPPSADSSVTLKLGAYQAPGTVILYEQPRSPWLLAGRLAAPDRQRLLAAGALLEDVGNGLQTVVRWPGQTLRTFMLHDVLLHEIGHHCSQWYSGKRPIRKVRTSQHEARAAALAARLQSDARSCCGSGPFLD